MDGTLELVPLCSAVFDIGGVTILENSPMGTLMIGEIKAARFEGERFSARLRGVAAADWVTVGPDGTASVDVRMTVETSDGAAVYVHYTGRTNLATGMAYTTPRFVTGDDRYRWLNGVQAVAKGSFDATALTVTYPQIYELR
jgi:Protein of unknown function (DUF3237)